MKGQYKMILFYNITWLELGEDESETEVWCFFLFFFSPGEGNEQPLEQHLPTVEGGF